MSTPNPNTPATQGQVRESVARVLKQKYILDQLYAIHNEEKEAVAAAFQPGDKAEIKNAQGVKIGTVSMSNPSKKAVPDDQSVLLGYAVDNGYEVEDYLPEPGTSEYQQVIDLVYAAGREEELLVPGIAKAEAQAVCDHVLKNWEFTAGKELPTGWTIQDASQPRFTISKGRSAQAKAAFEAEMAPIDHVLGETAFRELEKGEQ